MKLWRRRRVVPHTHVLRASDPTIGFRLPPLRKERSYLVIELPPDNLAGEELDQWYDDRPYVCDCSHFEEFHDPGQDPVCMFCHCQGFEHTPGAERVPVT